VADPFASPEDLESAWRPLSDAETSQADYWLGRASRVIRKEIPTVDARIASGDLDSALVADVAISMVIRYMRNPDGKRQETIEDYSFTRDATGSSGEVKMTPEEVKLLTPIEAPSCAFSIDTSPCTWPPSGEWPPLYVGEVRRRFL
jgi:Phage protein Gp19/Gp15/Gp42